MHVRHQPVAWLALWCCLAAAAAVVASRAAGQATDGKGACRRALSFDDVFMPPQAEFLWRLEMTGTRNFSCYRGGLEFGPAMGLGNITGPGFDCLWYYETPFLGVVDCFDPAQGPCSHRLGRALLDTTVQGAVFVLPSPDGPDNDVWGRFIISTTGVLAPANYVVRYNTSGGAHPARCDAPRGQWVTVPFTAVLDGYLCE